MIFRARARAEIYFVTLFRDGMLSLSTDAFHRVKMFLQAARERLRNNRHMQNARLSPHSTDVHVQRERVRCSRMLQQLMLIKGRHRDAR